MLSMNVFSRWCTVFLAVLMISTIIPTTSYRTSLASKTMIPQKHRSILPTTKVTRFYATDKDTTLATEETGLKAQFKAMWQKYGYMGIGFYLTVYITVLSSIYFSLDLDLLNAAAFGVDPTSAVKKVCNLVETVTGNGFLPGYINDHPKVGTFAIAWVMTKFTEPLRLGLTIAALPTVARVFGRGGSTAPVNQNLK